MRKKSIKYLLSYALLLLLVFFSGCSSKNAVENTNNVLYTGVLVGFTVVAAPILIPTAGGMYGAKKTIMHIEYKDLKTKQSLIDKHGYPDNLYEYQQNQIWGYYEMASNSDFEHDVFFLIHNNTILDYYSELDDINDWKKYKLVDKELTERK